MPHLPEPVTVTIEYSDADGIETRRTIDVYRTAKKSGYTLIYGWCHGRQAERSFRSDRLHAVIDQNGKVLSAVEFLARVTPGRSKTVDMAPIRLVPDRAEPVDMTPPIILRPRDDPATPRATEPAARFGWGQAIFLIAMAPGVLIALGLIFSEGSLSGAAVSLLIFCVPVWMVRAVYRRLTRGKGN